VYSCSPMSAYCMHPIPVVHNNAKLRLLFKSFTILFTTYVFPVPAWPHIKRLWPALAVFKAYICSIDNIIYVFASESGKYVAKYFDQWENALQKAKLIPEVEGERSSVENTSDGHFSIFSYLNSENDIVLNYNVWKNSFSIDHRLYLKGISRCVKKNSLKTSWLPNCVHYNVQFIERD
jgi:predicted nucleic acid-binding Zn finger protein